MTRAVGRGRSGVERGSRGRAARGRLIVLEGLDGAGTTTQARLLAERLRVAGRRVHVTAEPSGGPIGALIRQALTGRIGGGRAAGEPLGGAALALLFAADRLDHLHAEISPKLLAGIDVVCDRFTLSSLAYQGAQLDDTAWVETLNREAAHPDLVLFLRVRPEVALRRRQAASIDRELFEVESFQRRVARSYDAGIRRLRRAGETIVEIDGEAPVAAVTDAIWAALGR